MDQLLFLTHRIPFPPDKGDKIRSYHMLQHLRARYRVHLGTFVDEERDWKYLPELESICEDVCARPISPRTRKVRSLTAFLHGEPLSLAYYRDRALAAWVNQKVDRDGVRKILVFSSPMAQYVPDASKDVRAVVDFVDVDSEKWRQYASRHSWPTNWIYGREARTLLDFERRTAARSAVSVFVSPDEAELFRSLAPEVRDRVHDVVNGVDAEFFSPLREYENPYDPSEIVAVFVGRMDYWANADAAVWFAEEVFPAVKAREPRARFAIVGAEPTPNVKKLAQLPGVTVTGRVEDVRPYVFHSRLAVVPLRVARGIQCKLLEAMAMARPAVATYSAVEGIALPSTLQRFVGETPEELQARCLELMGDSTLAALLGQQARDFVTARHVWSAQLSRLDGLIDGIPSGREAVMV
jgi:sugar transferase (PEP-CTERM/EpsH1 system associated)